MRSRSVLLAAAVLFLTGSFTGCAAFDAGPRVTDVRDVGDIHAVVLDSSGDLRVAVGTEPSLRITAGEDVIGRLSSEVVDGVLTLAMDDFSFGWTAPIRYELTVTSLESLIVLGSGDAQADFTGAAAPTVEVRGSGDVEASGMQADTVAITSDGSGEIEVRGVRAGAVTVRADGSGGVSIDGVTDTQDVEVNGSGSFEAEQLASAGAVLSLTGSGDASVSVTDELDVAVEGSGSVSYRGDPVVTERISGSGEVRRG